MGMVQLVVTAVVVEGRSKGEVARDYGISWRWVVTLVQRFLAEGEAGLRLLGLVEHMVVELAAEGTPALPMPAIRPAIASTHVIQEFAAGRSHRLQMPGEFIHDATVRQDVGQEAADFQDGLDAVTRYLGFAWQEQDTAVLRVGQRTSGNLSITVAGIHDTPKMGVLKPIMRAAISEKRTRQSARGPNATAGLNAPPPARAYRVNIRDGHGCLVYSLVYAFVYVDVHGEGRACRSN